MYLSFLVSGQKYLKTSNFENIQVKHKTELIEPIQYSTGIFIDKLKVYIFKL